MAKTDEDVWRTQQESEIAKETYITALEMGGRVELVLVCERKECMIKENVWRGTERMVHFTEVIPIPCLPEFMAIRRKAHLATHGEEKDPT